jgi:hypothetical protein
MRLSRNIVLLLCAGVVIMTSIGMNSFSLFLRPIEAGFGWSRTVVTIPYMFGMLRLGSGRGAVWQAGRRPRRASGHSWRDSPHGRRFLRHGPFAKLVATIPFVRNYGRHGEGSLWTCYHLAPCSEALRGKESRAGRQCNSDGLSAEPAFLHSGALLF